MSDLLNSASLVMVPSGYKEDTVYSVVPSDGSGDLSFTRASNGTRINSAGLVEVCPWNNCTNTETFSSTWTALSGASVTANNTTAPNGTNTGARLTVPSTAFAGFIQTIPDNTQTLSIYAKKGTLDYLWIIHENISQLGASFNLDTGVVSFVASGHNATMESVGNGWYRCILSTTNSATWDYFQFGLSNASNSAASPSGGNAYIWGAQANIGSTAKPYFPTTDRLNVPRLTYQNGGGGCPSLLLEKQSTNLVSYSQDFSNAFWNKTNQGGGSVAVVTANYAISPDGTQNATRFVCNLNGGTTSSDRSWMLASFTAPATSTLSIWIKLNSAGTKTFVFSDSGGGTKTISGTDWQRIDSTLVGAGGEFRIGLIGGSSSDTLDCCIWGAQAESGSYPTSYIPTTSSSATRVADACSKTGISSLIGQTEGVAFVDFVVNGFENYGTPLSLNDGSTSNYIWFTTFANGNLRVEAYSGGAVQAQIAMTGGVVGQRYKMAFAYKTNDFVLYINGTQIGTDSSGSVPPNLSRVDFDLVGAWAQQSLKINQVALFKTRLTNAELASLTTI